MHCTWSFLNREFGAFAGGKIPAVGNIIYSCLTNNQSLDCYTCETDVPTPCWIYKMLGKKCLLKTNPKNVQLNRSF